MGLSKYRLGDIIENVDIRNTSLQFGVSDVRGISNTKEMMPTKADMLNRALDSFKVVPPRHFVYNRRTTRMGDKFALTLNETADSVIVTDDYIVFRVKDESVLVSEYLFMFFNRPEFDRYVRFNSWGSATEMFVWDSMCDVMIVLPDINVQRDFVSLYKSLKENLSSYESNISDLKIACDGYIDQLKLKCEKIKLGEFIEQCDERNINGTYCLDDLRGVSIEKRFIESKADMMGVSLLPYTIVRPEYFVFVPVTSRNGEKITLAMNDSDETYIVSSAYTVFRVKDKQKLLPDYLFMIFNRPEFDRYARFNSWGSAREVFTMDDMNNVEIPIPDINVQQEIVNIHKCYIERQRIASRLKEQLNNLCPILIKGSLETSS